MSKIKAKDVIKGTIKSIDKSAIVIERTKDVLVNVKEKSENAYNSDNNINEYASNKVSFTSNRIADETISKFNIKGKESVIETKENIKKAKTKVKTIKSKLTEKRKLKKATKGIKNTKQAIKNTQKVATQTVKTSNRAIKLAQETIRKTVVGIKAAVKVTVSSIKAIIAGTKALISALIAGGWVVLIVIIVICLIGLLCSSIFGIFLSNEKLNSNSITMRDAIMECNQEFADALQKIQDTNPHDEYVLDGSMAIWKDILLVYTIKQSNGTNQQEVLTMNNSKKQILKDIFWEMNKITSEVKDEIAIEQGTNSLEMPKEVQKKVLHIKVFSKTFEQMKTEYHFSPLQISQYNELASDNYSSLWNNVIYGMDSGEYISWRQKNAPWSNIRIGTTSSTIGDIGCLVTSIAILIQKSGVDTSMIIPFNPGTFIEELNKNLGFDNIGNLQYSSINKVVPCFKYVGNINLRGKTRSEKLSLISQYFNLGYYLTVEVKGATEGNQHWVAVTGIDGNNVVIVDPATNHTDMWSAYEFEKTSQFNYFQAN